MNRIPINCLEDQLCGLESSVRKFPGLTYNNCPVGSEVLPFSFLVLLKLYKPVFKAHLVPVELTALSRSCGTEEMFWSIFNSPASSASFCCLLAPPLNLRHPRISVSLILIGTPERRLSGPDLLGCDNSLESCGASTKHSHLRHKWTSCCHPVFPIVTRFLGVCLFCMLYGC